MKSTIISIIISVALICGAIMLTSNNNSGTTNIDNVNIEDGKQIIEITARGGYQPRKSMAKAGIPTILRFDTSGTFDCSSYVRIPSMDISKSLPHTGTTDIDIGSQKTLALNGTCGMGMYPFEIDFVDNL